MTAYKDDYNSSSTDKPIKLFHRLSKHPTVQRTDCPIVHATYHLTDRPDRRCTDHSVAGNNNLASRMELCSPHKVKARHIVYRSRRHIVGVIQLALISPPSGLKVYEIERTNEWAQRSARAKQGVRSKGMIERCEGTNQRRSEWPSTLRVDFIVIQPMVRRFRFCVEFDVIQASATFLMRNLMWLSSITANLAATSDVMKNVKDEELLSNSRFENRRTFCLA